MYLLKSASAIFGNFTPSDNYTDVFATLYGGAHLFKKETPGKLAGLATNHLTSFAPDPSAFVEALQIDADWILRMAMVSIPITKKIAMRFKLQMNSLQRRIHSG